MTSQTIEVSVSLTEQQTKDLKRFFETTEDNQGYDVPADRMKSLSRAGLVRSLGFSRYEFTDVGNQVVERLNGDLLEASEQDADSGGWVMNPCKLGHRDVGAAAGIAHCYQCDEKIVATSTEKAFKQWNATHPPIPA